MLILDTVPASEVFVTVEHRPPRPIPRRKQMRYDIPGRSGALIVPLDAWENVTLTYDIAILPPRGVPLGDAVTAAVAWFSSPGYRRLEDTDEPGIYYLAAFPGGQELADVLHRARRARVSFDAMPQRWRKDGEIAVRLSTSGTLRNPTANPSLPLLRLSGSGAGTLTINGSTLSLSEVSGQSLDCERRSATGGGALSGNWPTLAPGANGVSFTGGITAVEITGRWFDL